MKTYKILLLTFFVSIIAIACEDAVPNDYQPKTMVEGYLIVDEPIGRIIVLRTQPVRDSFNYANSLIRDAAVRIIGDDRIFDLVIDSDGEYGYYYPDVTYLVKPNTSYQLEVRLADGTLITGSTETPSRFNWVKKNPKLMQYPIDTINLPLNDSLRIEWEKVPNVSFCGISVKCLDSLNYGMYLNPPTEELNRRMYRPFQGDESWRFQEMTSFSLIQATKTPVVWWAFRWFGLHEVSIIVPEWDMVMWMMQAFASPEYNPLLSNVEGGMGVFTSCSMVKDTVFVLKNQP